MGSERGGLPLVSLGGCATYEVLKRTWPRLGRPHDHHYWRRPTIALVAEPCDLSIPDHLPPELTKYLAADCGKSHLAHLRELAPRTIVFDVARDIWSGVLERGPGAFIMDPFTGLKLVVFGDDASRGDDLASVFDRNAVIDFESECFMDLWSAAAARFCRIFAGTRLVCLELYYLTRYGDAELAGDFLTMNSGQFALANRRLAAMYDVLRGLGVAILSSRTRLETSHDVEWSGPFPTHYVSPVYDDFALQLCQLLGIGEPDLLDATEAPRRTAGWMSVFRRRSRI